MLLDVIDKHAPFRNLKLRDFAPAWLTGDFLTHIDEREYWSSKFAKNPCQYFLDRKRDATQRTNDLKDSLKRPYIQESLRNASGDMKRTLNAIKKFWPTKGKKSVIQNINGHTESEKKANIIN